MEGGGGERVSAVEKSSDQTSKGMGGNKGKQKGSKKLVCVKMGLFYIT